MKQVSEASPADPQVVLVWEKVDSPKFPLLGSDVAVSTECVGIGRWKDKIPASKRAWSGEQRLWQTGPGVALLRAVPS